MRGSKYHFSGLLSASQRNTINMAFFLQANDGPALNAG